VSAKLIYTGRKCVHVTVKVSAGDPKGARSTKSRRCVIAFVALDDQGAPAEIERWRSEMEEDAALEQYAKKRARIRATLSAERDRSVPVMDVKAVEGRSVGRCP